MTYMASPSDQYRLPSPSHSVVNSDVVEVWRQLLYIEVLVGLRLLILLQRL